MIQQIHTRIYTKTDKELSGIKIPIKIHRGIDWLLEENKFGSNSYSILEQALDASGSMILKMRPRPTDWIGSLYLDTIEQDIEILKQDTKAIWIRQPGLEYIHFYSEVDSGVVEVWKRF
jgi:hypothetical protein